MHQLSFEDFYNKYKQEVESVMEKEVQVIHAPSTLKESMLYSLLAGGKRIRPLLLLATIDAFKQEVKKGLKTASAIEMIHTYSLIHDDLPCMDDDDYRRGKLTNHKKFDEATALLAGDALLTHAFTIIASQVDDGELTDKQALQVLSIISSCSGAAGMIGGQMEDMNGEAKQLTLEELEYIHVHKTGKLLEASIVAGAIIANASLEQIQLLKKYAYHLGLAFQIRDDILDIEGTAEEIGKTVGSDLINQKSTYPSLFTLDGAKKELTKHIEQATFILNQLGIMNSYLLDITNLVANRSS